MDSSRVEGYLRSACSVLDFDIGEFWKAEKIPGRSPTLNFVQIYTSPSYDRSLNLLLLKPEMSRDEDQTKAEELHQISPVICRSVCDGGQIVWANSNVAEGLVENSKVRLATAVGMPICSVGGNLCVIVLFATQPIPMTPNAVEFLCSMARAASGLDNTSGFASSPYSCTPPPSHAKTDQFRGVWDISERLNSTYSTAIDFHLLPIKRLQAFFDFQEVTSLNDLSDTHSAAYPLKVPGQYDFPPFEDFSPNQSSCSIGNGNVGSESDDTQWINANFHHSRVRTVSEVTIAENKDFPKYNCLTADALTMTDISIQRLGGGITAKTSQETNSCGSSEIDEDEEISDASSLEFVFEDDVSRGPSSPTCLPSPKGFRTAIQIDARTSFRTNQSRFHEFMDAILGLTHFDCAELWLLSDRSSELYVVSALHGDEAAHVWTMQSKGMRLKKGMDVPGIVFETGRPHWDKHYDTRHLRRASRKLKKDYSPHSDSTFNPNPRSELASKMGMCTAFGVPLPGPTGGISGVLALYSRVKMEPDPLLLTLVHKSVQLMSSCSATVRTSPLYPETDYYKENSQNNQLSQNNSQNNLNAYHDLPSISENPYSYFCQSDQIKQQQYQQQQQQQQLSHQQHTQHPLSDASSKLAAHSFSSTDFASKDKSFQKVSEDKSFVSDNNLAHNGRNHHQNQNPSLHKRGWTPLNQDQHQQRNYKNQNQHSMSGMTGNLYRTVSANELNSAPHQIPHPHPIYHSHSMPDSMYLESSYANLEIPKSKRARSIDLGSGPGFYNMLGSIPASQGQGQGMLQNIQIPSGVEVYDHMDLHWSSLTKPYDGKNVASSNVAFPFNNSNYHILGADNFPYRGDKASLVKSKQQQYVEFSTESNDTPTVQQKRSQYDMLRYSFQHEMPLLQPVIKVDPNQSSDSATTGKLSAKSKKLSQSQLSLQSLSYDGSSPVDAFNSDLNFTNEFGFIDRDLIFNGYPSSVEEPSSPAAYPPCRVDGCGSDSSHRSPFCVVHAAGGRRCQQEGCNKCAQGSTCYCIAHGGGRRCTFPGCGKGARDKFFCAGHGGGKRCMSSDCTKSAVGGSKYCTGHGGGKRCKVDGCDKSAQSSTLHCVKHGGGRKCTVERCTKVARGKTDFCAAHGGGMRCRQSHCSKAAVGRYQYCRPHYSAIHGSESAAKMLDDEEEYMVDEDEEMRCGECTPITNLPFGA